MKVPNHFQIADGILYEREYMLHISRVSCQKGPTRHAYAWQIGPFWQDTLDILDVVCLYCIIASCQCHELKGYDIGVIDLNIYILYIYIYSSCVL